MTVHIKIVPPETDFNSIPWTPWKVTDNDQETTERLAVYRFLRQSGGFAYGESIRVKVYSYDETTPRYASGSPKSCKVTEYKITREEFAQQETEAT